MFSTSSLRRQLVRRGLPLLIIVNLLLLLYYVAVDYQVGLHADSAVMNLLAQEMYETGSFFPSSWYYANRDLWIAFTQLPVLALLPFTKNSFALHAFSSAVTAALVLGSVWWVGGMLGQSRTARAVTLLVLAGGVSANMAENLYGQAAYGLLFAYSCLLAFTGWRLLHAEGAARWRWGGLFALLALQVFWANPQRALVFYGLPLMAAIAARHLPLASAAPQAGTRNRATLLISVLLAGAAVLGIVFHTMVVKHVGSSGMSPPSWLDFDGMVRNTLGTLRGLLSLLGGLPEAGLRVTTGKGVLAALRLVCALSLLVLLPWAVIRALHRPQQGPHRFFAIYTVTAFSLNLLVALATSIPDMGAPESSVRYLVPALLCALVLLAGIAVDDFRWHRPGAVVALVALLLVGLTAAANYKIPGAPRYFPEGGIVEHSLYSKFARFEKEQGLKYGYSTFWNAGTITVLSGHAVRHRSITIDHGLPMPVYHLSSSRWFQADTYQGETFLMFNYDEIKLIDWERLASYLGQPVRVLEFGGCKFYVYSYNIASKLPLWDGTMLQVAVTATTGHHIGQLDENGKALHSTAGESGHLRYGPVLSVPAGDYEVSFDLETAGNGATEFGIVDAVIDNGTRVLANKAITAQGRQRLLMPMTVPSLNGGQLELRVLSNGAGAVTLRDIVIRPTASLPSTP